MKEFDEIGNLNIQGFKNINVKKCLKMNIILSKYKESNFLAIIKNILVLIRTLLIERYKYSHTTNKKSKLLFAYSHIFYRRDSINKFMKIANLIEESDIIFPVKKKIYETPSIESNPSLKLVISWIKELRKIKFSIDCKIRLIIQLIQIYQFLYRMEKIDVNKYNLLTVYYDASPLENALVQIFKNNGVKTATLQHGMFISERDIYNPLYSGVEFKSFISDNFLAWNEFTKRQMIKEEVNEEKIQVLGIPKYVGKEFEITPRSEKKIFGVVLDVPESKKTNEYLIKIANQISKKYDIKYKIKYHPNAKKKEISKKVDSQFCLGFFDRYLSVEEYRKQIDFTVIGTSSVFIELVIMKHPTLRLSSFDKYDKYLGINENAFDEFSKFIQIFENKSLINKNINILFNKLYVTESLDKYINFFSKFS